MPSPVKQPTYRQQQAAQTKTRIAHAARTLFAAQGYRPTSVEAIAAEAGVATRTVYAAFGAKREILSAICEQWLADARALEIVQEAVAEPDATATLRIAAHFLRSLFEHGYDVVALFEAASDDDPATRSMLRAKLDGRNQAQDAVIASIGDDLAVPLARAQSIYRGLASIGLYTEFVIESGWSIDEYEDWIAELLGRELLG